jgi:hypothetical protein
MSLHAYTTKSALIVALSLVLAACGKQDEQPTAASASQLASAPAFPAGNSDKPLTLAQCEKLPDPKPAHDSAAGRATAVSQGVAARAACKKEVAAQQDKPNADLARIRAIKEKEQADEASREVSNKEWFRGLKEGAGKPIRDYKY